MAVGGGWQLVGGSLWVASGRPEEEEGGADTTLKTKTPHVYVGNKSIEHEKQAPRIVRWR